MFKRLSFWFFLIVSFLFGIFVSGLWGKSILKCLSSLFLNINNEFDMSIFWSGLGTLATLFLGIVALLINSRLNKRNHELEESREIVLNSSHIYSCNNPLIKDNIVVASQDTPYFRKNRNEHSIINQVNLDIDDPCWYTLSIKLHYSFSNRPSKFSVTNATLELVQNGSRHKIQYKNLNVKDSDFRDVTPETQDKLLLILLFEIKKLDNFNFSLPYDIDITLEYILANTWNRKFIVFTNYICSHKINVEEIYVHTITDLLVQPESSPYKSEKYFKNGV